MKAVSLFQPSTSSYVAANEREMLAKRYAGSQRGWNAVAASVNGKTAAALGAESEGTAVKQALAKIDRDCPLSPSARSASSRFKILERRGQLLQ